MLNGSSRGLVMGVSFGLFAGLFTLSQAVFAASSTLTLPSARVGALYTATISAQVGELEPYVWQVSTSTMSDILPPGVSAFLSHNRDLGLRGTPTRAGTYQFTAEPFSASGTQVGDVLVTLEVQPVSDVPLLTTGPGMRAGTVGVAFDAQPLFGVDGGVGPYHFRMVGGGLPRGLSFTESGAIEGVPTVSGQYLFQAEVDDVRDMRSTTSVMISVNEPLTGSSVSGVSPIAVVSTPFTAPSSLSLADRQAVLAQLGVSADAVIETTELDPLMQHHDVYYVGADGRRHAFQSDAAYQSWYGASPVAHRSLAWNDVMSIPFGEAVTYRPGERVQFQTDTQTYVVSDKRTLRPLADGQTVSSWTWQQGVRSLDDACRGAYQLVAGAATPANFDPAMTRATHMTPNEVLAN